MGPEQWVHRWPNFRPPEVLSPRGMALYHIGRLMMQPYVIDSAQEMRSKLGVPILCNFGTELRRGYRSCEENQKAGGENDSRHLQGLAMDLTPIGMKIEDFFVYCVDFGWSRVILYERRNFVHCDMGFYLDEKQMVERVL